MGLLIHFAVFGWLAMLAAGAAVATGYRWLRVAAVILATVSLVLYNANLGIVAFTLVTSAVARSATQMDAVAESA
jgi:hypothetical protein